MSRVQTERSFDKMDPQTKTAPEVAPTNNRGLPTPTEEVTDLVNATTDRTRRQQIAREYLRLSAEDLARASLGRIRFAHMGKSHGLTNAEIGDELGITEAAVRAMLKRHPDIR